MAQFASDTFTGTSGTLLDTYSANWVKHGSSGTGTVVISNANRARPGASGAGLYYHTGAPSGADYSVSADIWTGTNPVTAISNQGICARLSTSANSMYLFRYSPSTYDLYRIIAGAATQLQTVAESAPAPGSTTPFYLSAEGTGATVTVTCKRNGTNPFGSAYSDTHADRIVSANKAGIRTNSGSSGTDIDLGHWDNFSADDIGAVSSAGPIIKHFRLINGGILMQSRLVIRSILRWLRGGSFA